MEHILVVEDEASLRVDLADFLSVMGYAVSGAATAAEARAHLLSAPFDAVILDIGLPDGSGFDILAEIRSRKLSCGVVMLTAYAEPDDRIKGLEDGADAYLVKKATLREVEATLRSVLRRLPARHSPSLDAALTGWTFDRIDWRITAPNGATANLSGIEAAFLMALAECHGKVCPRDRFVEVMGRAGSFDERSLDDVVKRLRKKINKATSMDVPIKAIYGSGYIFTANLTVTD